MKKEEILKASRLENKIKDFAEMEIMYQAGAHAVRVGALACCIISVLSSVFAHTLLYSPWVIYFSIMTTQWFVRYIRMKHASDLVLAILFGVLGILSLVGLARRLLEARSEANLSQAQLAEMVGVSRNTISSIETGQFNPTAKLALILCIALDKKFEELFYF